MQSVEIYIAPDGRPLGQLPLPESLEQLEIRAKQHPRLVGELRALILRLQQLGTSGKKTLKLFPSTSNRSEQLHLQQLMSGMIYRNIGTLYCPHCSEMIDAERVIYEEFKRGKYEGNTSTGKRFYCPRNHMLFEHLDIRF